MNKIRKILVILLILIMWGGIKAENAVYAKASEAKEENFANIVLFAHFAGENSKQDAKYFEENRNEIIKLYDGTHGRSATNYLNTISYGKFHLKNIFPQDDGTKITSYELKTDKSSAYQQKGKLADCAFALLKQLNKVDFPTFGSPTIPHCKPIIYFIFIITYDSFPSGRAKIINFER